MTALWAGLGILGLVAVQRITELFIDRRHTAALVEAGGIEHGAKHYPLFILLHSSWLVCLFAWVIIQSPAVNGLWLVAYFLIQVGRVWVLRTLGPYWTTRIVSIPERPLVTSGPYRFLRHPNYVVVVAELAVLPLVFGAWQVAVIFSVLNAALLHHRIKVENAALELRRQ